MELTAQETELLRAAFFWHAAAKEELALTDNGNPHCKHWLSYKKFIVYRDDKLRELGLLGILDY